MHFGSGGRAPSGAQVEHLVKFFHGESPQDLALVALEGLEQGLVYLVLRLK